jgi:hypothetical protein
MKFIYFNETNDVGEVQVMGQRDASYFGPRLVATCEDFDLYDKLVELGDKLNTTNGGFLVVDAEEYRTDSTVSLVDA